MTAWHRTPYLRNVVTLGALAVSWALAPTGSRAQVPARDGKGLDAPVHLDLGSTTLRSVAALLSEQSKLRVQPASYLLDHRMVVHLSGLSTHDALDALSELNDWQWQQASDGQIVIARSLRRLPSNVTQAADALRAALPRDMRRYLGFERPDPKPENKVEAMLQQIGRYRMDVALPRTATHLKEVLRATAARLLETLPPPRSQPKAVPYRLMTPEQQQILLEVLVLDTLQQMTVMPSVIELWQGTTQPFEEHPLSAEVSVHGGGIDVGTTTGDSHRGFGAQLPRRRGP